MIFVFYDDFVQHMPTGHNDLCFYYDIVQHMPTGHNDLCFYDDNVQHMPTVHNDLCFVMIMFNTFGMFQSLNSRERYRLFVASP